MTESLLVGLDVSRGSNPIPYQGSKRMLAPIILEYFPVGVGTLYEPFAGSAAVSLAAVRAGKATRVHLNDSLKPLMRLWERIVSAPDEVSKEYAKIWKAQDPEPRAYYDQVRDLFNRDQDPAKLLFLLARCVKNAVRFNGEGNFNQSPDKRRRGTHPDRMKRNITGAARLLDGKSMFSAGDYSDVLPMATPKDLVYMDPPYQGTSGERDQRYHQQLDVKRFIRELGSLIDRDVPVIVSFDGRCGERTYGKELPASLGLVRVEVHAGRSSQATLNGEVAETFESLYMSPRLFSLVVAAETKQRSVKETPQPSLPGMF
jgi:DNA adenine methylase